MKKITGAKIDGKIVKVIESKPYEEGKIEVFFMYNGITRCGAIVSEENLITEELTEIEIKAKELINLINEEVNAEIDVDDYDENKYKNRVTRKTSKGVINYIKRFI